MKKLLSTLLLTLLCTLLPGCKSLKKIEPEKHFSGAQLMLAKAIQAGDRYTILRLAKKTDLSTPGNEDLTILFFALNESFYNGNPPERLQIVTDLVRLGADPLQPQKDKSWSPAEMVAMGDKDIWLKAMLDGGLDANAREKRYAEPLIFSTIRAKNNATLALLLARGADVNSRDSLGNTLLAEAFYGAEFDKIALLLDKGADPDLRNHQGDSFRQMVSERLAEIKKEGEFYHNLFKVNERLKSHGA
ncbi:ankyrin repeat domain-containing protein [Kosakonia sp. S58]|uniref:ankyrin repeat domain-containing protein n=1 Tax=unclassified Kosakonia TaxID=2632876 RepID=UPI0019072FC8|nr:MULTISPECIES: ankyrin repeat domain-containing protein [unclassified Kosakonia]MBK0077891.1 ankyrin repeat domain-containing protein [Kosakonia sp. S57]MBK0084869.1 ankyrin repeat domain-containing protein [Kosakonia sp. S58]